MQRRHCHGSCSVGLWMPSAAGSSNTVLCLVAHQHLCTSAVVQESSRKSRMHCSSAFAWVVVKTTEREDWSSLIHAWSCLADSKIGLALRLSPFALFAAEVVQSRCVLKALMMVALNILNCLSPSQLTIKTMWGCMVLAMWILPMRIEKWSRKETRKKGRKHFSTKKKDTVLLKIE